MEKIIRYHNQKKYLEKLVKKNFIRRVNFWDRSLRNKGEVKFKKGQK